MKKTKQLMNLLQNSALLSEQYTALQALEEKAASAEVTVSVIGQFKRGKSSLINAMLDEDLLPVGIIPLTTVITEIRHGPSFSAEVIFEDGSRCAVSRNELAEYCSEQSNPGNEKHVQSVQIQTPRHPFGPGVVLVDTPGVGSVHQNDTDTSYAHIARSDAILFLLSVDSPVSQAERDFLLAAREYASRFFFAVNKADSVSGEDLHTFQTFCAKVIADSLGTPVSLYPVSARTGLGVDKLTDALAEELKNSGSELLRASIEQKAAVILAQIRAKTTMALETASLPAEELNEKLVRLEKMKHQVMDFSDGLDGLARRRTETLVCGIRDRLDQESAALKETAQQENERLYQELKKLPSQPFRDKMRTRMDTMLHDRLIAMNETGMEMLTSGYRGLTALLNRKTLESEQYAAALLEEELGLPYPVSSEEYAVSSENDFFLQIGIQSLPYSEIVHHLLPRRTADRRFLQENLRRACEEIDCNENNMLYNYRYKMQESLRTLCTALSGRLGHLLREIDTLTDYLQTHLHAAHAQCISEGNHLQAILRATQEIGKK